MHTGDDVKCIEGYNFFFSKEAFGRISANIAHSIDTELFINNPIIHLECEESKRELETYLTLLVTECSNKPTSELAQIARRKLMFIVLVKLLDSPEVERMGHLVREKRKPSYNLYISFTEDVETHCTSLHKVKDYAQRLNTSTKTLNECARMYADCSASHIINQRLLSEAERLLLSTNLMIKQVADNLHFSDSAHFLHFFRKNKGISPTGFRLENKH